jgi:hypothetical protein
MFRLVLTINRNFYPTINTAIFVMTMYVPRGNENTFYTIFR